MCVEEYEKWTECIYQAVAGPVEGQGGAGLGAVKLAVLLKSSVNTVKYNS